MVKPVVDSLNPVTVTGKCEHCGDEAELYPENNRCEECDGLFFPCAICKEEVCEQDLCRHIWKDENCEWQGSGVCINPALKKPLFRLFDLMPAGFAVDLRCAIKSGKFYTWRMSPLIGSGHSLELHGMPEREMPSENAYYSLFWWGNFIIELGEGEHSEEIADAYHWLASLYERKTLKANRATIKWIDEYLNAKAEGRDA